MLDRYGIAADVASRWRARSGHPADGGGRPRGVDRCLAWSSWTSRPRRWNRGRWTSSSTSSACSRSRASRWSTSRTSSTRSSGPATRSPCCGTGGWSWTGPSRRDHAPGTDLAHAGPGGRRHRERWQADPAWWPPGRVTRRRSSLSASHMSRQVRPRGHLGRQSTGRDRRPGRAARLRPQRDRQGDLRRAAAGLRHGGGGRQARSRTVDPGSRIRAGVAMLPEDRKAEGIIPELSVRDNIALAALPQLSSGRLRLPPASRTRSSTSS